jgi:replication factor C subunit 1
MFLFAETETTTATLVAKEAGRDLLEFNASDARSKKALQETMGDLTGSQSISFPTSSRISTKSGKKVQTKKRCVIMDEVDGMGAGDRSGMAELIQMIKKTKIPIICICNDRQSQKMKSLLPYCMDLKFSRPTKHVLANRAVRIAESEGLVVERNAAEAIAESCGNDVRQILNLLQMWASKERSGTLTYRALKDRERNIQKDEILRVSLFDAAKSIVEGRQGLQQADAKAQLNSLFMRSDAFFVDYSMVGLIVQQNYLRVIQNQHLKKQQKGEPDPKEDLLERMHQASMSMSDYNLVESQIRGGDGNWGLLPTAATLTVKCGYHAGGGEGGFLGGFPEFTAWMGKNSTMGKNYRLLNELNYHISQKVSAHSQELRQTYIPVMRERILMLLKKGDPDSVSEVIGMMDEYGLSREDIADKLDIFCLGKKEYSFEDLDSKQKAAFTREYNAGSHRSQALVREQGGGNKVTRKGKITKEKDPNDLDAIDEDDIEEEEEENEDDDEEKELKKLQEQFKKKGRKKPASDKASAPKKSRSKK